MNKKLIPFLLSASAGFLLTGCAVDDSSFVEARHPATRTFPSGELVVMDKIPPPEREYFDNVPDYLEVKQAHYWVEGYWSRSQGAWVWIPGHWE